MERNTRFELATFALAIRKGGIHKAPQRFPNLPTPQFHWVRPHLPDPIHPKPHRGSTKLRVQLGSKGALLSVAVVASQLGVCTASVYALCQRHELAHVRVLNAIRVAPADLAAFIEAKRT